MGTILLLAIIIWVVVHFVRKAKKEEAERQEAEARAQQREREQKEAEARRERERLEDQAKRERQQARREVERQQRAEQINSLKQSFKEMSFEKLRFEHERRERAISEIRSDMRLEEQEHSRFVSDPENRGCLSRAYEYHSEKTDELNTKILELKAELELIENAMS